MQPGPAVLTICTTTTWKNMAAEAGIHFTYTNMAAEPGTHSPHEWNTYAHTGKHFIIAHKHIQENIVSRKL
jgi:hypothetical protein